MTFHRLRFLALTLLLSLTAAACAEDAAPKTEREKASYSLGMQLGESLKNADSTLVIDQLVKGLRTSFNGEPTLISREEAIALLQEAERSARSEKSGENLERSNNFLRENGLRDSVKATATGLQYEILSAGDGKKPGAGDKVRVHYRGTLINGAEFDSSYERGSPATFGVNQVIAGWTEALQLMPVGSKWKLYIPPTLAYGERGAGRMIGPNEALVFEVELLAIVDE